MVSPSGAFFSLRCLIYKVHAAPGGTLLLYLISSRLSRTFFQKFLTPGPSRIRSNLFRLPHFSLAVKSFFLSLSAAAHHRADSFVRIPNPSLFVNTLFHLFSPDPFFSPGMAPHTLLYTAAPSHSQVLQGFSHILCFSFLCDAVIIRTIYRRGRVFEILEDERCRERFCDPEQSGRAPSGGSASPNRPDAL